MIAGGGGPDVINNKFWPFIDVRDVADALLLLYEKAESSGRYICSLNQIDIKDLLDLLKSMYPNYNYVDKIIDVDYNAAMTSDKLKDLGWKPRKLEETLADSVECYAKAGLLQDAHGDLCRLPHLYRAPVQE